MQLFRLNKLSHEKRPNIMYFRRKNTLCHQATSIHLDNLSKVSLFSSFFLSLFFRGRGGGGGVKGGGCSYLMITVTDTFSFLNDRKDGQGETPKKQPSGFKPGNPGKRYPGDHTSQPRGSILFDKIRHSRPKDESYS